MMNNRYQNRFFFYIISIVITFFIYLPGLKGGFLFDDFPNLGDMTRYGNVYSWNSAKNYIFNGFAGPTGRPISLATFWLTGYSWVQGDPLPFKLINLLIHLLCGIILFNVIRSVLVFYNYQEKQILFISLFSTTLWLVHPMFVSTTLYVVQRMTQLSLVFTLCGIWGYLYGRILLDKNPKKSYLYMTISIVLGTVLATFSKENGALLPILILTIEFCNPNTIKRPNWKWFLIFLLIPAILVIVLILKELNFSDNPWPSRNFNQVERVLSETRILSEYLYRLFIPQIEGKGLYQDGYVVSRSLFEPIETLYTTIFICLLFLSSILLNKKYPLYALSILFFFMSHLMESTIIGLELYFEHRNYSSAIFIFLPLASRLWNISNRINFRITIFISLMIVSIFSILTLQRSYLWGDTEHLKLYWAQNNQNSPRAQSDYARYLLMYGKNIEANAVIEKAIRNRPDSSLLTIRLIRQKIDTQQIQSKDFRWMASTIINQRPETQSMLDLRYLIEQIREDEEYNKLYAYQMLNVLKNMEKNPNSLWRGKRLRALLLYLQGKLYLSTGNKEDGYNTFLRSLSIDRSAEKAIAMTMEFTQYDLHLLAYKFLGEVKVKYIAEEINNDERLSKMVNELENKLKSDLGINYD